MSIELHKTITFRTDNIDHATGIYNETGELPETEVYRNTVNFLFSDPDAQKAARKFMSDAYLQHYLSAKRTIFRLFRQAKTGRGL
ncbi:MAG: hypothetical protein PHF56_20295 [Desulfuromonadaceae bacterium]|nr:hypothetical protein [Desulfuromonadaceae bacterium]